MLNNQPIGSQEINSTPLLDILYRVKKSSEISVYKHTVQLECFGPILRVRYTLKFRYNFDLRLPGHPH